MMEQLWQHVLVVWEWGKAALAALALTGLTATALVAAAYAFFKFLGEKWITQKFAESLEAYKAEQTRELERLRLKINGVFDRTKRLHDKEFEVLPDIWAKLVDAQVWAASYMAAYQQYPDLRHMNAADLDEFLAATPFSDGQKRDIKNASSVQDAYIRINDRYRYAEAMDRLRDANTSLSKHGIFVVPEVRDDIKKMIDLLNAAMIEHQTNEEANVRPRVRDSANQLRSEGTPLFRRIEQAVVDRLWDSVTAEV